MSDDQKKTKTIAFRVDENQYLKIQLFAHAYGKKNANDWCRDIILQNLTSEEPPDELLTAKAQFEELAKLRYLVGVGFGLLATDDLTKQSWDETKRLVDEHGAEIAAKLLARRKQFRSS